MSEPAGASRRLVLELPASHQSVRVGRNLCVRFARMGGVPSEELDHLRLVVSELLANAVDHGAGASAMRDRDAKVRMGLAFEVEEARWVLEVHDQGGGTVEEVQPFLGNDLPDLESERGRGFFLLEQMLDTLEARTSPDGSGLTFAATRSFEAVREG